MQACVSHPVGGRVILGLDDADAAGHALRFGVGAVAGYGPFPKARIYMIDRHIAQHGHVLRHDRLSSEGAPGADKIKDVEPARNRHDPSDNWN